jgi:RNA polymerase sporulation-specific sigma factor
MTGAPVIGRAGWLIEAARQGEHAAQREVLRRYEPLVQRVVSRLRPPAGCERDDLAQEARIGLLRAIRAWRPERGPFPAFADRCVRNQALLAIHAAARHKHQLLSRAIPLDSEQGGDPINGERACPTLLDALAAPGAGTDPEARLLVSEQLVSVVRALPTLTESERRALTGALEGLSYERLAPVLGGTRKAAAQAAYRARRKLAAALPRAA